MKSARQEHLEKELERINCAIVDVVCDGDKFYSVGDLLKLIMVKLKGCADPSIVLQRIRELEKMEPLYGKNDQ